MNKKLLFNHSNRNLSFWILSIFATISFMMQICNALLTIKGGGVLNNVTYNIFEFKLSITRNAYSNVYTIGNYPLVPILAGIIYNTYIILKNRK